MLRRSLIVSTILFAILFFSDHAWSSVVDTWDITGTMKVKVSIIGYGSQTEEGIVIDEFIFYEDGSFGMIDMTGTWVQALRKFEVYLDPAEVEAYFENGLASEGFNADIYVTSTTFKGQESKYGDSIKGKITLKMTMYLYDYGAEGKVSCSIAFQGIRATGLTVAQTTSLPSSKSLSELIMAKLRAVIPVSR